jgi:hypothetical protein
MTMSMTRLFPSSAGSRCPAIRWGALAGLVLPLLMATPVYAAETVCPQDVKAFVLKTLTSTDQAKLKDTQDSLYKQFAYCAQDAQNVSAADTFFVAARQCGAKVSYLGSLFYEEMPCCGYDPQRRQFACPVQVKQCERRSRSDAIRW